MTECSRARNVPRSNTLARNDGRDLAKQSQGLAGLKLLDSDNRTSIA